MTLDVSLISRVPLKYVGASSLGRLPIHVGIEELTISLQLNNWWISNWVEYVAVVEKELAVIKCTELQLWTQRAIVTDLWQSWLDFI